MTLHIGSVAARELADEYGTPLNVIDEEVLLGNLRRFRNGFAEHWPGPVAVLPAIKAGTALEVLRVLRRETPGCDLFSEGELRAALASGFKPAAMSLNGNGKLASPHLLRDAVATGVRITLDDLAEVAAVERAAQEARIRTKVRLRMRPNLSDWRRTEFTVEPVPTYLAVQAYKAGMPLPDLIEAGRRVIASPHLELTGLHMHLGRHRPDLDFWDSAATATAHVVKACLKAWPGWIPQELDLGGGFAGQGDSVGAEASTELLVEALGMQLLRAVPPPLRGARDRLIARMLDRMRRSVTSTSTARSTPTPDAYAERICGTLRRELDPRLDLTELTLEVEPGRGLYTDAGSHLTTVTSVKRQTDPVPWTWVLTDTSTTFLPDGATEFCRYPVDFQQQSHQPIAQHEVVDVVGLSCAADRLVPDLRAPTGLAAGDLVVFRNTGAYNEQAAGNFNSLPRPATVIVDASGGSRLARRRETLDDVFAREVCGPPPAPNL